MKRLVVTWRVSFYMGPAPAELDEMKQLLGPIARVEVPADFDEVMKEYKLSEHLLIEDALQREAGEVVLDCMTKAHRLGRGWRIRWPETPAGSPASAFPEAVDGLSGYRDSTCGPSAFENLAGAGFSVRLVADAQPAPAPQPPAPVPDLDVDPANPSPELVSQAIVLWLGRGTGFPRHDEERVARAMGARAATALMPRVRELHRVFNASRAIDVAPDLARAAARAADEFRRAQPEISDQAVDALAWAYAYSMR